MTIVPWPWMPGRLRAEHPVASRGRACHTRHARRAFSAIELLIVVVIIGLMAAAAMPRIGTVVAQERMRKLQLLVANDIELAFELAQREHKPVTITYSTSTKIMTVTDRAAGTVLASRYLGQSAELSTTAVTFSPSGGITIFPMGLASAALTVSVSNGSFTRTVSATRAGLLIRS